MLGLNAFALVAFGAIAVLAHRVSRGAGAQRAVRAVSAVLLGVNVLRYALIGPLLGELRVPVEYSAFAYFAVPLILLTGWKGARSWAAYSGLMAGFFYYLTMIAAGGALYGENPHWEIYLSLFCHGALFFCGFVTVSTLPCTGGVWQLVGGTAYVALRAALLRPLAGDTGRLLIYILLDAVPVRYVLPEALWCVAVPAFYLLAAIFVVLTARAFFALGRREMAKRGN